MSDERDLYKFPEIPADVLDAEPVVMKPRARGPDLELLRHAYEVIDGIPEKNFDLSDWTTWGGQHTSCRTVACAAGWLIRHRDFQVPEFGLDKFGVIVGPTPGSDPFSFSWRQSGFGYAAVLFNLNEGQAEWLFDSNCSLRTDKEEWLRRVRIFLEGVEA